jgi:3-mercaptopyruvate sulfurtransferase SseA
LSTPTLPDAVAVSAEVLMSDPARFIDGTSDAVLVVCDIGVRSDVIATQLHLDGYETVASLEGGIAAWSEAGYPTRAPAGLSADEYIRYDRQLSSPTSASRCSKQSGMRGLRSSVSVDSVCPSSPI